jgi:hypothetical protein
MRIFHQAVIAMAMAPLALLASGAALAEPFVAYDDGLQNGWQNWSWAKVQLALPAGGAKPIKVEGDAWSALALHHDAFSTQGFSKLTFSINGGASGGQALTIKAMVDGKPVDSTFQIVAKAKTWALVEVPLKELGVEGKTIDGIAVQGQATSYSPYYITRIQFE